MDLTIIITAEYMYEQLIGIDKNKTKSSLFAENPRCAFSPSDYGRNRETGVHPGQDYLVFYGLLSVCLLRDNHILLWNDSVSGDNKASFSPKRKSNGNITFILIAGLILAVQIRFPEVLLTSIFPTVLLLGIYIDFENPFIRKQTVHNEEMLDGFATMVENGTITQVDTLNVQGHM